MAGNRHLRTLLMIAVTALIVLAAVELGSFLFFTGFSERFTFHEVDRFLLPADHVPFFASRHDPELGWDARFDTPHGERPRRRDHGRPLVAAFGDSWTYCSDVGDDDTWENVLADSLGADVYNFGVPGFGTDQAYLRFLRVRREFTAPVTILGLVTENINRIVSVYRPFYFPKTGIRLPKPRFVLEGNDLRLLPNPLREAGETGRLCEESFLRQLGARDFWYNRDRHPVLRFPYARILFSRRMWREAIRGRAGAGPDDTAPRPWENLWKDEGCVSLMLALVDAFAAAARADGSTPVFAILPLQTEVFETACTGKMPRGVATLAEHCARRGYHCVNTIPAMVAAVERPG